MPIHELSSDFAGKVALVSGASRGIGRAVAARLAAAGCEVVMLARKAEPLMRAAAEISAEFRTRALPIACHCGKAEDIAAVFSRVQEEFGRLDILVNNAATNPYFGPVRDGSADVFRKILDTNVVGYYQMSIAALPLLEKSSSPVIVNVSSVAGKSPAPLMGFYSISKAAVDHLTRTLARELGPNGVRVVGVAPGLVRTDFSQALWASESILEEVLKTHSIKRIGEPHEVAEAIAFLASEKSSYINGSILYIDGGEST